MTVYNFVFYSQNSLKFSFPIQFRRKFLNQIHVYSMSTQKISLEN